jgi:hypothetical protein
MTTKLNQLSLFYAAGRAGWAVYRYLTKKPVGVEGQEKNPYRPPQWKNLPSDESQLILVKSNIAMQLDKDNPNSFIGFYFDAFLREDHELGIRITEHPVQNGANVSDHAYSLPACLTLEILVSDTMDQIIPGQFLDANRQYKSSKSKFQLLQTLPGAINAILTGGSLTRNYVGTKITYDGPTKSMGAYNILKTLQDLREPLQVTTRFGIYKNMLIENIHIPNDYKTPASLRATVTMKQIIMATVATVKVSSRPQTIQKTNKGNTTANPASAARQKAMDERAQTVLSGVGR